MNVSSLVGHILELAGLTDNGSDPADRIVSAFFRQKRYLGASDRRFISETLYGIIRHRRFIEALLEEYVRQHPGDAALDSPHLRYLPLTVEYSLLRPGPGLHPDGVDTAQQLSSLEPLDSLWRMYFPQIDRSRFTGWVTEHRSLDFLPEDQIVRLGVRHSFQDWMVREWCDQFGSRTEQLLESLNVPARVTLRVNLSKAGREECRKRLLEEGIETRPAEVSPAGLIASKRFNMQASAAFKEGWFEMQDEGSQMISLIADPQPGSVILDACAGAGGKSLHLADLLRGSGTIFAIDVERLRLDELDTRARRAGVTGIEAVTAERMLPERFSADLVLVDAPCTGVGTIRRNPGIKWRVSESSVGRYAEKQERLLDSSSRFVKQGGRLMYATCSLLRGENEEVAGSFLEAHPEFHVQPVEPGLCPASMVSPEGFLKILPCNTDTDGFFAVMMHRRS